MGVFHHAARLVSSDGHVCRYEYFTGDEDAKGEFTIDLRTGDFEFSRMASHRTGQRAVIALTQKIMKAVAEESKPPEAVTFVA